MDICRTCLETPAEKDISELEVGINEENKSYFEIMMFCLNIKVTQDSKITTSLCNACYIKIISFYTFKTLSLKNDNYLKSLDPLVSIDDKKPYVYEDESEIKHENSLVSGESGQCLVEDDPEIKIEFEVKKENILDVERVFKDEDRDDTESDKEPLSVIQREKNNLKNVIKEIAPVHKKRGRPKKINQSETAANQGYQVCEECGKSVRDLKQHTSKHVPAGQRKTLQCDACPKLFCTKGAQQVHYKTAHLGIKSHCDICSKEVTQLSKHKLIAHNRAQLPHGCVSCARRFISRSALATHVLTHTKDAFAHECHACHMKFARRGFLSRHVRQVHDKERRYQCEFCSKAFFNKYALERHIMSHRNERPYKCEECGKTFSNLVSQRKHQLIHTGVKDFRCDVCDTAFMRMEYLRKHMITHTKEKKYPCRYCGRRFGRTDHRRNHEITAHHSPIEHLMMTK